MNHETRHAPESFEQAPLLSLLRALMASSRLVLGAPALLALLAGGYFFFFGSHVARSSFTPQTSGPSLGGLASLATQFGANLPGSLRGDASESLDFYAALLLSPELLSKLSEDTLRFQKFPDDPATGEGTVLQLYGIIGENDQERRARLVELMQTRVSSSVDRLGNVVVLKVKAPWPGMAMQINRRLLDRVNEFNLQQRQTAARAQRVFTEARTQAARLELASIEDSQRQFLERNRSYAADPKLVLEAARLQRQLDLRQAVFTTLTQSLEQARIDEVRNTPVITVIDRPELFTARSRSYVTVSIIAFIVGLGAIVSFLLGIELLRQEARLRPELAKEIASIFSRSAGRREQDAHLHLR